jgi:hypothetical protein
MMRDGMKGILLLFPIERFSVNKHIQLVRVFSVIFSLREDKILLEIWTAIVKIIFTASFTVQHSIGSTKSCFNWVLIESR